MTALTWTETPQKQEWMGSANGVDLYVARRLPEAEWMLSALWPESQQVEQDGRHILNAELGKWPRRDFPELADAQAAAEADLVRMLDLPRRAGLIVDAEPAVKAEKPLALGQILAECLLGDCEYATIRQEPHKAHIVEGSFDLQAVAEAFLAAVGNRAPASVQTDAILYAAAVLYEAESSAWGIAGVLDTGQEAVIRKTEIIEEGFQTQDDAQARMTYLRRVACMRTVLAWLNSEEARDHASGTPA